LDFTLINGTAVRDLTDELINRERADLKELKKLQKDVSDLKDTTLWSLLVELMQRDTDKHIAMLRFVQTHT
jgi:bacterioferritin (cytochrome b1)